MRDDYNWFILYTRSNAEKRVMDDFATAFEKRNTSYELEPFCPESEIYYRGKTKHSEGKTYRKRPLFPNYVFLETDMPEKDFVREFSSYIYNSPDIVRMLRYGGSGGFALNLSERQRFEYLFRGKRCLERSEGYIEGDKIIVTAGALVGHEGLITRINRHNRFATIKVEMFGQTIEVSVALEIVEKS